MKSRLKFDLAQLMMIPGLAGYEDRVRRAIATNLAEKGIVTTSDRLGNLMTTFPGHDGPSVMIFAHMDQLGLIVRKIRDDGLILVERMGGIPERALASQSVTLCPMDGPDITGIIYNKSHHATKPGEKYNVATANDIMIDTGLPNRAAVEAAGIRIGTPVVYTPNVVELGTDRIAGTSVDDRAGCAVLIELARQLQRENNGPTVHIVFSVQEEFNLRGAMTAAHVLQPDIAIQLDLMLTSDTPEMADRGEMMLGGGPGMSMYSFHGRGTLNGVIPHPAMVRLIEDSAAKAGLPLQRSAQVGILTDLSYVQQLGQGVACIDLGFPCRYTHSSLELCDLNDLTGLTHLLATALANIGPDFNLSRD